jgi:hypothetical protein
VSWRSGTNQFLAVIRDGVAIVEVADRFDDLALAVFL